jgi:hypothetical protein
VSMFWPGRRAKAAARFDTLGRARVRRLDMGGRRCYGRQTEMFGAMPRIDA